MRRALIPVLTVLMSFSALACTVEQMTEEEFFAQLEKTFKTRDDDKIQQFFTESKKRNVKNPEYYVAASNYWWAYSQRADPSAQKPETVDSSVRDPGTGSSVDSKSPAGRVNPEFAQKAIATLKEATQKFPGRVDLAMGLAHMQMALGLPDDCTDTLLSLVEYAGTNKDQLKWRNGKPVPQSVSIPLTVFNYAKSFFMKKTPENDRLAERLSKAAIEAYPQHPYNYNLLSRLYHFNNDLTGALKYAEKAHKLAPDDPLISLGLATLYSIKGDNAKAIELYEMVLASDVGAEQKKAAQERLEKLKPKK